MAADNMYEGLSNFQKIRYAVYVYSAGLLLLKVFFVAVSTGMVRRKNKVVLNQEDAKLLKIEVSSEEHPLVLRVKRAHLNDLENIPAFLFAALIWIHTEPDPIVVHSLVWIYTIARFLHTAVYAYYPVPQPARGICFIIGLLITLYMIISSMVYFAPWLTENVNNP